MYFDVEGNLQRCVFGETSQEVVCVCVCAVEGKGPLRPEDASRDRASNLPLGALSQTEDISIPK